MPHKVLSHCFPPSLFSSRRDKKLRFRCWIRGLAEPCLRDNGHTSQPPFCQRVALRGAFYERNYRRLAFCLTLCNAKCHRFAFFLKMPFLCASTPRAAFQYLGQVPFRPIFKTSTATLRNANVSTHGPKQKFTLLHKVSSLCFTECLHFALCQAA